ncbi:hypothetical protein FEV09_08060, partial [Pseudanabaena catenata USMAC16]
YSVYNGYAVERQQKCLAHLRRHFKALLKLTLKSQQEIGKVFIRLIDEAFEHHATWRIHGDNPPYLLGQLILKFASTKPFQTGCPRLDMPQGFC